MEEKTSNQMKLGEYIPTSDTENKAFQEDAQRNFRIVVGGESSEWKKRDEVTVLKVHDRIYIGVGDLYDVDLPKRCALKVDIVDEDGESDFYKFKITDLIAETVLDAKGVEDAVREAVCIEHEYSFKVKNTKLKDFVKIAMTECEYPCIDEHIMTKERIERYLGNVLPSEEFEVINEDGVQINKR